MLGTIEIVTADIYIDAAVFCRLQRHEKIGAFRQVATKLRVTAAGR